MLYYLLYHLKSYFPPLNLFHYITFRAGLSFFTAFIITIAGGPFFIRKLSRLSHPTLEELNGFHQEKEKIPTMGGILLLLAIMIATFFWADLTNIYILLCLFVLLALGVLGFYDDCAKLRKKNPKGIRPRGKLLFQIALGAVLGYLLCFSPLGFDTRVALPFFKRMVIQLGPYYLLLAILIIMATSNAVNLTDGLDGLAIGSVLMIAIAYGFMSYLTGHKGLASYLNILYVPGVGEVSIFCGAIIGAALGFLWFNAYPAQIFMGDTGSLALGGVLGLIAMLIKQEISLIIVGGIFVIEAASVIIQVSSFKLRGKRVFLMTPLHHHFELKGIPESKIVVRFWILAIILALFSLITLKIR